MSSMNDSSSRRGSFLVAFSALVPVFFGFAALSIDISYMQLTQSQAQDISDAAALAAMAVLRQTRDTDLATRAAVRVVQRNTAGGQVPDIDEIAFGSWSTVDDETAFVADDVLPNAVRVTTSRRGSSAVPFFFGHYFDRPTFDVRATATSATRSLHLIVVTDITNSWSEKNFEHAREASVHLLDMLEVGSQPSDLVGMTVFTNRFGWEFTPLTPLTDAGAVGSIRDQWGGMRTASKKDKYPHMPTEFGDEPGTDHTTGMEMARLMFEERTEPTVFRVMIVLTDGQPNGLGANSGATREEAGYTGDTDRWRQYTGPAPRGKDEIKNGSVQLTAELWNDLRVHTYVVSFVADGAFMHDMTRGQGTFALAHDASELLPIFEDIGNGLPLVLVE